MYHNIFSCLKTADENNKDQLRAATAACQTKTWITKSQAWNKGFITICKIHVKFQFWYFLNCRANFETRQRSKKELKSTERGNERQATESPGRHKGEQILATLVFFPHKNNQTNLLTYIDLLTWKIAGAAARRNSKTSLPRCFRQLWKNLIWNNSHLLFAKQY